MKIIDVDTVSFRPPEVRGPCDSGQDALIVKVSPGAGVTGTGEIDSAPLAAGGRLGIPCAPGPGAEWNEDAIRRFRVA